MSPCPSGGSPRVLPPHPGAYPEGGMSVENRSVSVSASSAAFIPRELSTCRQKRQHSTATLRSSKVQLPADMAGG